MWNQIDNSGFVSNLRERARISDNLPFSLFYFLFLSANDKPTFGLPIENL